MYFEIFAQISITEKLFDAYEGSMCVFNPCFQFTLVCNLSSSTGNSSEPDVVSFFCAFKCIYNFFIRYLWTICCYILY